MRDLVNALILGVVEWLTEFWAARQTRAWVLAQTPLLHVYGHYFEAPAAPYENVTLSGRKRGAGAERPRRLTSHLAK